MSSRRTLKAAEAIREVVASAILTELRDPRVRDVTVTAVKVTPDMREAVVSVSVMGDATQEKLSLRGLQNSAGFLQSRIAGRIETRYVPKLTFKVDRGVQHSMAVGEILAKIQREREELQSERGDTEVATTSESASVSITDDPAAINPSPSQRTPPDEASSDTDGLPQSS